MMKNKTNSAKTMLFASLIAVMILPVSTLDMAYAATTDEIKTAEEKIEEFKQRALRDNRIPSDELLERVGDKWLSEYKNEEHFEKEERDVKRYVERNSEKGDLNQENAEYITKIQNFETITNSIGDGHEIVLLVAELEKINNMYNPSEPVRKYHDWIATQYEVQDSSKEIHERLLEIIGDKVYLDLVTKHASNFNQLAENGSVPSNLMKSDPDYWNFVIMKNYCKEDPKCNVEQLIHQPGSTEEEITEFQENEANTTNVILDLWNYILPEAFAIWNKVHVNYIMTAVIDLEACRYFNCYESWYDGANLGSASIDIVSYDAPAEHVWSTYDMTFYGTACDTHGGSEIIISEIDTTPYLAHRLTSSLAENDLDYNNCVFTSSTSTATRDWVVGILVESDGSYYWAP